MEDSTSQTHRKLVVNGKEVNLDRIEDLPPHLQKLLADKDKNGVPDFIENVFSSQTDAKALLKQVSDLSTEFPQEISFREVKSQHWNGKMEDLPEELKQKLSSSSPSFFEVSKDQALSGTVADADNFFCGNRELDNIQVAKKPFPLQSWLLGLACVVILFLLAIQFGYLPKFFGV